MVFALAVVAMGANGDDVVAEEAVIEAFMSNAPIGAVVRNEIIE